MYSVYPALQKNLFFVMSVVRYRSFCKDMYVTNDFSPSLPYSEELTAALTEVIRLLVSTLINLGTKASK